LSFKDECGIFGIYNNNSEQFTTSLLTYYGLFALQHRGQESAGIVTLERDKNKTYSYRQMGRVSKIFNENILNHLAGDIGIGHVRYSTHGASAIRNIQPLVVEFGNGPFAIAHNGNLVNSDILRKELQNEGSIFHTTVDTEVIVHLMSKGYYQDMENTIITALNKIKGAFSLVMMSSNNLIAARDPYGFRPLSLGKLGDSWVVASETSAFDLIRAEFVRDIEPGEVLFIDKNGLKSLFLEDYKKVNHAHCVFEFIYFARPDSLIFGGKSVYELRKNFGRKLAQESNVEADMVIPVPDSGVPAAIGYSQESNIPFEMGLIRNHYVGRSFIQPDQNLRDLAVKLKLNPVRELFKGKKIIVIDDSIVRGTTSRKIINMLREAGAKEIHLRISSPPVLGSCYYGIDTPAQDELIANVFDANTTEIKDKLGADSLEYLSLNGLNEVIGTDHKYCLACFNKKYPVSPKGIERSPQMSLFELSKEDL